MQNFYIKRSELVKALSSCLICGKARLPFCRQINIKSKGVNTIEFSASDEHRVVRHVTKIHTPCVDFSPFAIDYVEATLLYSHGVGYQKDVIDQFTVSHKEGTLITSICRTKMSIQPVFELPVFVEGGLSNKWEILTADLRAAVMDRDQFLLRIDPNTGLSTNKGQLAAIPQYTFLRHDPIYIQRALLVDAFLGVRTKKYTEIKTNGDLRPVCIKTRINVEWQVMPYARPSDFSKTQDQVEDDEARCLRARQGDGADGVTA